MTRSINITLRPGDHIDVRPEMLSGFLLELRPKEEHPCGGNFTAIWIDESLLDRFAFEIERLRVEAERRRRVREEAAAERAATAEVEP